MGNQQSHANESSGQVAQIEQTLTILGNIYQQATKLKRRRLARMALRDFEQVLNGPWEEQDRDQKGRWSASATTAAKLGMSPKGDTKQTLEGRPIPPGWTDVYVATDPKEDLHAIGIDKKGRTVRIYSKEHAQRKSREKYERVSRMAEQKETIHNRIMRDRQSDDPETRDKASCLALIEDTGMRPGSGYDTRAAEQAYGATTLEGRHVVVDGDDVRLQFVGKKAVNVDIPVQDESVKADVVERKLQAGDEGQLFDTTERKLQQYSKEATNGQFRPKDFRTLKGTETARRALAAKPPAADEKEYKQIVREVGDAVSAQLGNTRTIALNSYIDPRVFRGVMPPGMIININVLPIEEVDIEYDPDDEKLDQTPSHVVYELGFDPREFDEDEDPDDLPPAYR